MHGGSEAKREIAGEKVGLGGYDGLMVWDFVMGLWFDADDAGWYGGWQDDWQCGSQ
ncbi:hypothetical protein E2542_SST24442 [Spatholobus suberectus]|nr:hypothetical protein E2542_SST24442 [Spatholobus suberectus]